MKFESFKVVKKCLMINIKFSARKFLYKKFFLQPVFLTALLSEKGRIRIRMRIREALKQTNPSDPDPQFHAFNPDHQYREKRAEGPGEESLLV